MKDNLRKEIEQAIEEHEEIHDIIVSNSNQSPDKVNRLKFAAIIIKKVSLLNKIVILDNLLEKYFNESYPLEGVYADEKKAFNMSMNSVTVKDDEIIYTQEYGEAINSLQEAINNIDGK